MIIPLLRGPEGSLNFLLYNTSSLAVPVLNKGGETFSVGTARLIPIQIEKQSFTFSDSSEMSNKILYDMMMYRIIPYLLDTTNFVIYTFSHQDINQNLIWSNKSIKKSLSISASPSTIGSVIEDKDDSIFWTDF